MSIFEEVVRTALKNGITVEFSPVSEILTPDTYDVTFRRGRYFSGTRIAKGDLMHMSANGERIEGEMLMEALKNLEMKPYMEIISRHEEEQR